MNKKGRSFNSFFDASAASNIPEHKVALGCCSRVALANIK
jgi:hypothetical protein